MTSNRLILDLCGGTASWSKPYKDAGYEVIVVDPLAKEGAQMTVREFLDNGGHLTDGAKVHGILAAPPCCDFALSGSQWWKAKDADGRTAASVQVVRDCLEAVARFKPVWWALENPMGRIEKLVPELGKPSLRFHPCDYGDRYTKRTQLWGKFRPPMFRPVEPVMFTGKDGKRGSWMWAKMGGGAKGKAIRSMTPPGFARAFFESNP